MSWIQGIVGENITKDFLALRNQSLSSIEIPGKLLINSGGNQDTLHAIHTSDIFAVVAGIGLRRSEYSTHILTKEEWTDILSENIPGIDRLNGHFIIIRFKNNILECFSDKVGLRTLYFAHKNHEWIFGTNLSWVCQQIPQSEIQWEYFGSRWLCLQQFSHESPVYPVRKLPPNSHAIISNDVLTISENSPWITVKPHSEKTENSIKILKSLLSIENYTVKLGMSGGLDSRVLFSLLYSDRKSFSTYSFGNINDPDVFSARQISNHVNVPFKNIVPQFPTADKCLQLFSEYVSQSNLVEGAATSVRLSQHRELHEINSIVIDGGNGEIARRQFLQRLLFKGKKDVLYRNTAGIFSYLQLHRADIFNDEIKSRMLKCSLQELEIFIESLPPPSEIGIENFLDLWIVKTRIPLVASDEQARLDEYVVNFMPYSQPDFIQSVLNLPLETRKNNRLYKQIIAQHLPSLSNFNLIKNNISYPYCLSTLQSRTWIKIKSFMGKDHQDPMLYQFLETMKEYILDTLESQSTKYYSPYNYNKISNAVRSFYSGNRQFANEVNWWIAFDMWRRMVEK